MYGLFWGSSIFPTSSLLNFSGMFKKIINYTLFFQIGGKRSNPKSIWWRTSRPNLARRFRRTIQHQSYPLLPRHTHTKHTINSHYSRQFCCTFRNWRCRPRIIKSCAKYIRICTKQCIATFVWKGSSGFESFTGTDYQKCVV